MEAQCQDATTQIGGRIFKDFKNQQFLLLPLKNERDQFPKNQGGKLTYFSVQLRL
jgi:hypothetical protein